MVASHMPYDPKGDFNKDGKNDLGDFFTDPARSFRLEYDGAGARDASGLLDGVYDPSKRLAQNYQNMSPALLAQAQNRQRADTYSTQVADRTRAAQMALMEQMRAQMNGPSLAGLQGQRAMGQSGQQALMNAAVTGNGRGAMLQSQSVGAGMAMDVGQARLAEAMRAQAGIGSAAGALRGNDLQSAEARARADLQAQAMADQNARAGLTQGVTLQNATRDAALERYKLYMLLKSAGATRRQKDVEGAINMGLSSIGGAT
jgi:hypothetical protein